jgi:hypothetical protein
MRRYCFFRLLLAVFCFIPIATTGGVNTAYADLQKACKDYTDFLKNAGREQLERESVRAEWIGRFENELSSAKETGPFYFIGMTNLAGLYDLSKRYSESLSLLNNVFESDEAAPELRLSAGYRSIDISTSSNEGLEKTLLRLDEFEKRVEDFKRNGVKYSHDVYDRIAFLKERTKADIIERYGMKDAEALRSQGAIEKADEVLNDHIVKANEALNQYLSELKDRPKEAESYSKYLESMNWDKAGILYKSAQLSAKSAEYYSTINRDELAKKAKSAAVTHLETFFDDYPMHLRFSQHAATLLLQQKAPLFSSQDEYINYATGLMKKVAKGHTVLIYLMSTAFEMSEDPSKLIAANNLYDLVIELEKQWFPEEYKDHVNYQDAILQKADNYLQMGDMNGAGEIINILGNLDLKGDYFRSKYERILKAYDKYFQTLLGDMDTNDVGHDKKVTIDITAPTVDKTDEAIFIPAISAALKNNQAFVFDLASGKLLNPAAKIGSEQSNKKLMKLGKGDIAWDGSLVTVRKAKALTVRQESHRPLKCTPDRWCNWDRLPEKADLPYSVLIVTNEDVDYLISILEIKSNGIKITYKKLSGEEAKGCYPISKASK